MEIEALNQGTQGLYFNAAQAASMDAAAKLKKEQKASKVKKSAFASALERTQAEHQLKAEGLPPEIAGMDSEEAIVFLKDRADVAAEKLKNCQMPEYFADYREKVSQFMRYIVKTNYNVETEKRPGRNRRNRPLPAHTKIILVNKKLDEMAQWLLHSHKDTLEMLAKIDEIRGLLVDLMAA